MDDTIRRWTKYQEDTANGKPRQLLVEAVSYVGKKDSALDLGAGALSEVQFLLGNGFREVVAVDITPAFKELIVPRESHFSYVQQKIEDYQFPAAHFNLISAQFTLPFLPPSAFENVWRKIYESLESGGIFTGQLFGERDDWSSDSEMTFYSKEEVSRLIPQYELIKCAEQEYTEEIARKKHWHYFDLILKKPAH